MDIAETLRRARKRELMIDAWLAHAQDADGVHKVFTNSDMSQVFCPCGVLFGNGPQITEEEVPALMDG